MQIISHKNFLLALSICTLSLFVFAVLYKPTPPLPKLIASTPIFNAVNVPVTDPIGLKFDRAIDPSQLFLHSTPPEEWAIQSGSDVSAIVAKPKQFLEAKSGYVISIDYNGRNVATLRFTTIPQQGDPRYTQQVLQEVDRDYPLAKFTPYDTPGYHVVYSAPLTLQITLKSSVIKRDQAISDIVSWVTSVGGDASAHQYLIAH
jgi:hypothetical protein